VNSLAALLSLPLLSRRRLMHRNENSTQLIGIVLSERRFMEKLNIMDVQTLILDILTHVEIALSEKKPRDVNPHPFVASLKQF